MIATGNQFSVRDFIIRAASFLGITLEFQGSGVEEVGIVSAVTGEQAPCIKAGDIIVRVDPRYFRPTEVETLLGDSAKAREKLGWVPEITFDEMVLEMVNSDLSSAKQHALLKKHGYTVTVPKED